MNTNIENYKRYPLSEAEIALAEACHERIVDGLNDLTKRQGSRGMLVEVEIAALALTPVLDHAIEAAEEMGFDRTQAQQYLLDLVMRRAREIWGQGTN